MIRILLIPATFLILFACSEKNTEDTKSELSIRDKSVQKIDSIENVIRQKIDSAKNPGLQLALGVIKEYEIFAYKYPDDKKTPVYMFKSAQIFDGMLNDKQKAAEIYQRIYDKYEEYENRPMMLFYRGNSLHDMGDTTAAINVLQTFIAKYPKHEFADDAKNLIQFIRMDEEDLEKFFKSQQ